MLFVKVREQSKTAVASSGTLVKLLLGCLTVHSIFQLLLDLAVYLRMGELLKRCELIVWNESTRTQKAIKCLNKIPKDLGNCNTLIAYVNYSIIRGFQQTFSVITK